MPPAQPDNAKLVGETIAHYEVLDEIGAGAMGVVYRARDLKLKRLVAMKILPHELAADPERLQRFKTEARAVAALNHPNIVTIYSVEEIDDLHFITMELVEGPPLELLLQDGPLPLARTLELGVALADALSAAHESGVTHRDLKPANILIGAGDKPKVLDFGLAKMNPILLDADGTQAPTAAPTQAGMLLGTFPYMSPEQLQGEPADERSDIFALGIVLHQIATGSHPFPGETSLEVVSAILRDAPSTVPEGTPDLPPELGRILASCLEKKPDSRMQTAAELFERLNTLKLQLAGSAVTGQVLPPLAPARPLGRWAAWAAGTLLVLLLVAGTAWWLGRRGEETSAAPAAAAAARRPALAVLFFQNLSGEPELDWLSRGITDMLVTDLSQSPEIQVLSTDRMYHLLKDLGQLDEPILAPAAVTRLAERAEVGMVLVGSYAKVGEQLRIIVKLEDSATGELLRGGHAEGTADEEIFSLVDQLGRQIRQYLRVGRDADQDVEKVTTASLEAYRSYVEGTALLREVKLQEGIAPLKRALEIDPEFAMAFVRLATIYETLGQAGEAAQYHAKAFEHAPRLPAVEKLYVQGRYYDARWETMPRAISYLEAAVEIDPKHYAARHHLTKLFGYVERYAEAIASYEAVRERGFSGASNHALASMYASLDRFEEGYRLLEEFQRQEPDSWVGQLALGWHLAHWGRLDEAFDAYRRAEALRPGDPFIAIGRYRAEILAERWDAAETAARSLAESPDPYLTWRGQVNLARANLFRGQLEAAQPQLAAAAEAYPQGGGFAAAARCWAAEVLLQAGRPEAALAEAELALAAAPGEWPEREALFWSARALQALGRGDEATDRVDRLRAMVDGSSTVVDRRLVHHLLGQLALARGETASAIRHLGNARDLLPPRGVPWHWHRTPDSLHIWFALAAAHEGAGDLGRAAELYRRVTNSTVEHVDVPILYVRGIQRLADIELRRRNTDEAQALMRRYLGFWRGGELDRENVAAALAALEI